MNIAQTKQIDIVDFLKAIGCFPTRETACAAWFRAPYREDMTPSFKVNKNRNIWYDFGLARSGDIIDLGILIYHTNDIPCTETDRKRHPGSTCQGKNIPALF